MDSTRFSVGGTFRRARRCDPLGPIAYAATSGDFNPIHLDPAVARAAGFESNILQGMCTFAWLADAVVTVLGDPGAIRRMSARFVRPVLPGDVVTFEGRCVEARPTRVRTEVEARNQRGEEVLRAATVEASLEPFGSPPPPDPRWTVPPAHGADDARVGRRYGPYRYAVGIENLREFAAAVGGGIPARSFGAVPPHPPPHPVYLSEDAGRHSRYGSIIAPPTFAAALAVRPCAEAMVDVANGIDVLRVLHGDEEIVVGGVVRPGDQLDTIGEIVRVEQKPRFDVVVIRSDTVNQRGEKVLEVTSSWVARRP